MARRLIGRIGLVIPGICFFLGFYACAFDRSAGFQNGNQNIIPTTDLTEISASLNKLVASEKDPETLLKTAFTIKTNRPFGDSISPVAANFLLQKATNMIEVFRYNSNPFKAFAYRRMANDLQKQGVPIDIPLSNFRKVVINLQQKNYHYLFTRLQLQVKSVISDTAAKHKVYFAGSAFLVLAFIGFQAKKRRFLYPALLILLCLGLGILVGMTPENKGIPKDSYQGAKYDFRIENEIGATRIFNERHIGVGKLIWVNENAVGFSYHFSPLNISPVIDSIAKSDQLFVNTTASFVNNQDDPVGFSAVGGKLLNPMIHFQWDGLALITDHKIQVVPLGKRNYNNPRTNFERYFQLTQQVKNTRSDAFQVPLLVYNDSLLLNPESADFRWRENRFLMKVVSPDQKSFCLIAEMESFQPLASSTLAIFNKLKAEKYSVQYMALLDVGANNLFQVYNPDGKINQRFFSTLPAEKATNILAIYLLQKSTYSIEP